MDETERAMLGLAMLAYRGFGNASEAAIAAALSPWLGKLAEERLGNWELAWGPATFRAPTSFVDDAMMYVAKEQLPAGSPARYVVAIRGTNPLSAFDWVFGDLWMRLQVDWEPSPGMPPAQLSASTTLGLAIGQHLAATTPPSSAGMLATLGDELAGTLQEFAAALPELDPARLLGEQPSFSESDLLARIARLAPAVPTDALGRLFDRLDSGLPSPLEILERRAFAGVRRQVEQAEDSGRTLLQFLNGVVGTSTRVAVTGHSKGGALAIAVALWLAETWPQHQAGIECFSFAGPTAGNAAFAARCNANPVLRTHRIVNPLDVVPQAWVPEDLKRLAAVYGALAPALTLLTESVKHLGYTHVGGKLVTIRAQPRKLPLVPEITYQHIDAYLAEAAFTRPGWNAQSIFLGA